MQTFGHPRTSASASTDRAIEPDNCSTDQCRAPDRLIDRSDDQSIDRFGLPVATRGRRRRAVARAERPLRGKLWQQSNVRNFSMHSTPRRSQQCAARNAYFTRAGPRCCCMLLGAPCEFVSCRCKAMERVQCSPEDGPDSLRLTWSCGRGVACRGARSGINVMPSL